MGKFEQGHNGDVAEIEENED